MTFNIARQPIVPAFLILAILVSLAMYVVPNPVPHPVMPVFAPGLALYLPGAWLCHVQGVFPLLSRWISWFLVLFSGLLLGRLTVRYNLYSVSTCLAISIFGVVLCAFVHVAASLSTSVALTLLVLALYYYCRGFNNSYGFDGFFRGSIFLGLMPFVLPFTFVFLLLLIFAVWAFGRTIREAIVALVGLLVPAFVFCYLNWAFGGDFLVPLQKLFPTFFAGHFFSIFQSLSLPTLVLLGFLCLFNLVALFFYMTDRYAVGTKPRHILLLNNLLLLLCLAVLILPSATPAALPLLAVPTAILLPVMFVRVHHWIALSLYLILIGAALVALFIQ